MFLCKGNDAFERSKEEKLQQEVLLTKQGKISELKKTAYHKALEKSHVDTAVLSKASYDSNPEKSYVDSAARTKACYDKHPESGIKSTARSKACYDKDLEKSHSDSAARSKNYYEKDIETSRTLKRQNMCSFVCVHY